MRQIQEFTQAQTAIVNVAHSAFMQIPLFNPNTTVTYLAEGDDVRVCLECKESYHRFLVRQLFGPRLSIPEIESMSAAMMGELAIIFRKSMKAIRDERRCEGR